MNNKNEKNGKKLKTEEKPVLYGLKGERLIIEELRNRDATPDIRSEMTGVERSRLVSRTIDWIMANTKLPFWPLITIFFLVYKLWLDGDISWLIVFAPVMAMAAILVLGVSIVLVVTEIIFKLKR